MGTWESDRACHTPKTGGGLRGPAQNLSLRIARSIRSSHAGSRGVGQVHYIDEDSGPPLLFLHGNPTWSFLYRGIVIRLRKHFRSIAVDYPGFGLSVHPHGYGYSAAEHTDVATELVRKLGLDNLTIMGQDWGGPIGMRVALNEREPMRSLVLGNTW